MSVWKGTKKDWEQISKKLATTYKYDNATLTFMLTQPDSGGFFPRIPEANNFTPNEPRGLHDLDRPFFFANQLPNAAPRENVVGGRRLVRRP